jgi:membrane-associated phospholipid phosphatase
MQARAGLPTLAIAAFAQSVAAFALLAQAYATSDSVVRLDVWFANALHANAAPPMTTAVTAITTLGNTPVLALVAAVAAAHLVGRKRLRDATVVVLAIVGAQLGGWVLKALFERPRPSFDDPVASADWFSFPSGHAMSSIALYGALVYVFADRLRSREARLGVLGGVALLVLAIGFSRLYLGVHYLTDVLAGYSAGLAWLLLLLGVASLFSRTAFRPAHATNRGETPAA